MKLITFKKSYALDTDMESKTILAHLKEDFEAERRNRLTRAYHFQGSIEGNRFFIFTTPFRSKRKAAPILEGTVVPDNENTRVKLFFYFPVGVFSPLGFLVLFFILISITFLSLVQKSTLLIVLAFLFSFALLVTVSFVFRFILFHVQVDSALRHFLSMVPGTAVKIPNHVDDFPKVQKAEKEF